MSRVTFGRKRVNLRKLLGIRTRLALLALMLVAPLMMERVRSLEETRTRQLAQASEEIKSLVQHSADTQREIILATLAKFDGDKRQAAKALGISLKTLYNKLNQASDLEKTA